MNTNTVSKPAGKVFAADIIARDGRFFFVRKAVTRQGRRVFTVTETVPNAVVGFVREEEELTTSTTGAPVSVIANPYG